MSTKNLIFFSTGPKARLERSKNADREGMVKKTIPKQSPVREWTDAIIIAFLLAMFIRVFAVELYKIPSPSMTPTLLGTQPPYQAISFYDVNQNGQEDMLLVTRPRGTVHVFLREDNRYQYAGEHAPGYSYDLWMRQRQQRQDRILVGKFFYWFSKPGRGDIVVFKVPESIFESDKPIYIKRVVGLPNETLTFEPAPGVPGYEDTLGWLMADGVRVGEPEFFEHQRYQYRAIPGIFEANAPPEGDYEFHNRLGSLYRASVPPDSVYVFGDNTVSSQDSRY